MSSPGAGPGGAEDDAHPEPSAPPISDDSQSTPPPPEPSVAPKPERRHVVRKWQTVGQRDVCYILFSLATMIAIAGLTAYTFIITEGDNRLICSILLVCIGFSFYFIVFSVFCERPAEMSCFLTSYVLICYIMTCTYALDEYHIAKLIELCVVWILFLPIIIMGVQVKIRYWKSKRAVSHVVLDKKELSPMVQWTFRAGALLALDLELTVCTILFSIHDDAVFGTVSSIVVLACGLPVAVIFTVCAALTMRLEKLWLFIVTFFLCFLQPAYIFYVATHAYVEICATQNLYDSFHSLSLIIMGLSAVFMCVRVAFMVCLERVQDGFGNGIDKIAYAKCNCFPDEADEDVEPLIGSTPDPNQSSTAGPSYRTFDESSGAEGPVETPDTTQPEQK